MEDTMIILNLTQHEPTPEQLADGVIDLPEGPRRKLVELLTFVDLPRQLDVWDRAKAIAELAIEEGPWHENFPRVAMIGGAPYLMSSLESELFYNSITPVYSFSVRTSVEKMVDGAVVKTNVFKHRGFIEVKA